MSTSMDTRQIKLLMAFAKKMQDPKAQLTAAEEAVLGVFLPEKDQGLPQAAPGDARGQNALRRTNWFNGRFLTAEALRRQDVYLDARARLDAHLLMPGVVHGLGITGTGVNAMRVNEDRNTPPTTGGFGKAEKLTLSPGLAFDHVGRPILVSQPFDFTLEQLVATSRAKPRRVAPGGIEFAPCVCLVPEPEGPSGGAPAVRPGPYLLVIEPGEVPDGEAKVYGEACAGPTPVTCQAESWRGAFGLSLVRVPLELPEEEGLNSSWALRGTASAWWFDVFEHSLIKRWDPSFATDDGFRRPAGPGRHEAGAVALAMVWLGTDGSALFIDSWIPRRSVVATPGEDWHRMRFGAPPRAAAWARIHQFQAMLAESLARERLIQGSGVGLNLWRRGFRHIPPIGFLPLDPAAVGAQGDRTASTGNAALDRLIAAAGGRVAMVSGLIAAARQQAFGYFRGTTVIPYCVVALHDDDILEDLANVFDKDPVRVARRVPRDTSPNEPGRDVPGTTTNAPAFAFLDRLAEAFEVMGLDELVNRRTEIVKVLIPLQGLTRPHPVLGVVPEDARDQLADWIGSQPPSWYLRDARLTDANTMAGLRQSLPLEMLPRHFAVYVKQRMVLLEVLVQLLELLQVVVELVQDIRRDPRLAAAGQQKMASTAAYREAYQRQPAEKRALAEAALAEPMVRNAVVTAAALASPDLRVVSRNEAFTQTLAETDASLAREISDPAERERVALERTADAYAAEYPGFAVVQVMAAVQPPTAAKASIADLRFRAAQLPLRDNTGTIAEATVADRVAGGVKTFETAEASVAYGAMREAMAEKDASAYVADAPAGVTAKEVLEKPPAEAARLLGGEEKLAAFTAAMAKEREEAAVAAKAVTAAPPPPEVVAKVTEVATRGEDAVAALEKARDAATDPAARASLDGAAKMVRTLGVERTLALARVARKPA
ncbi:hypothetical protein [Falsiroseomonas oryzae]|uniref:hypothetical protein n=1 Tax=Falsiroseomonas oryzae TaxID=2766473 RepID=UPI0022EB1D5F|nr:hypothetical protein [Roseomonas sp. MO-31]